MSKRPGASIYCVIKDISFMSYFRNGWACFKTIPGSIIKEIVSVLGSTEILGRSLRQGLSMDRYRLTRDLVPMLQVRVRNVPSRTFGITVRRSLSYASQQ